MGTQNNRFNETVILSTKAHVYIVGLEINCKIIILINAIVNIKEDIEATPSSNKKVQFQRFVVCISQKLNEKKEIIRKIEMLQIESFVLNINFSTELLHLSCR